MARFLGVEPRGCLRARAAAGSSSAVAITPDVLAAQGLRPPGRGATRLATPTAATWPSTVKCCRHVTSGSPLRRPGAQTPGQVRMRQRRWGALLFNREGRAGGTDGVFSFPI